MLRLFIALDIPQQVKDELIRIRDEVVTNPEYYRWETPEKMHLTLKFIGDFDESRMDELLSDLEYLNDYNAFDCSISRFDFFFRKKEPVILWAGLKVPKEVITIAERMNEIIVKYGVTQEKRKFKPHLTLLRIKYSVPETFVQAFRDATFKTISFKASKITLYQSILKPTGAVYKERKSFHLEEK